MATLRDRGVVQPVKLAPRISAHQGVDEDEAGIWDLVEEFLSEERLYVRDLQTLLEMKDIIAQDEVFGGYQLHEVFGPLSRMVENQINFLMTLEVIASHDIMRQRWKIPFEMWQQAVGPYAVFIVHEQKNREILRSRLSTMDQRFKADDAVQSALSTCLRLLPTPFLLLARYNRFLRVWFLSRQAPFPDSQLSQLTPLEHDSLCGDWEPIEGNVGRRTQPRHSHCADGDHPD